MMLKLEESKHMEAEERNRLEDEIRLKQDEVSRIYDQVRTKEDENKALQSEMEFARAKHEEATKALVAATTTPNHHHVGEIDDDDDEMANGDSSSKDLAVDDEEIEDPVQSRLAYRNKKLQDQLKSLQQDLADTRDSTGETTMDRIHKENVKQGRDKYKTLREVRKGNTKRRVDQFENM